MRHRGLACLAAVAAVSAAVPSTAAAIRDVRVDIANATDRPLEASVWRDGRWRDLRPIAPGAERRNVTTDSLHLDVWLDDCGQLSLDNDFVGWPTASLALGTRTGLLTRRFSEGEDRILARGGLRVAVQRVGDTADFKEFEASVQACPDDPPARPEQPEWDPGMVG